MTEGEKRKLDLLRLRFIEWLGACNYAVRSREEYDRSMKAFINWLSDNTDVTGINEILPLHINQYQLSLCGILNGEGMKTLAISTQSKLLTVVRTWFEWLVGEQQLLLNPASSLQMPRLPQRLPRNILTQGEARLLLESTPIEKPQDIRDRAILEILYGSAIRRGELLSLTIYDVDIETKVLRIEQGKGGASRLVPLTETSINALKLYLDEVRIKWVSNISGTILFLSSRSGGALSTKDVGRIVENGRERAGITKSISPHTLRHSCATHLLQEDADIRQIQKLLGHRKLSTTEIYTHVEIGDLQKVIERCHPREKVMRDSDDQGDTKIS